MQQGDIVCVLLVSVTLSYKSSSTHGGLQVPTTLTTLHSRFIDQGHAQSILAHFFGFNLRSMGGKRSIVMMGELSNSNGNRVGMILGHVNAETSRAARAMLGIKCIMACDNERW
jgi:hypothetical protein